MPFAPVGILIGVEEHDGAIERELGIGVGAGGELIEQRESGFHTARLATVHAMPWASRWMSARRA